MYKVIIVDDEPIIRKGLRNVIKWKQFDCEICAEAGDGISAIALIEEHKPEIIFTDIKMPGKDGIAMIKEIKDIVPDSKIVILTGYRDFDYAREALKYGILDFLLKPTKIEEINSVVTRAVKEIQAQSEKADEITKLKVLFEQNIPILREKLLYDIIYGINKDEKEILSKMQLFGIEISKFVLILVENESLGEDNEDRIDQYSKHLNQLGIMNSFEETFSDMFDVISITLDNKWSAFIVHEKEEILGFEDVIEKKCLCLQELIEKCFDFSITVAVSSEGNGALVLPSKFKECCESLRYKLYIGKSSVIFYEDLNSFFKYDNYSILESYSSELLEGIKSGDLSTVKQTLKCISEYTTKVIINDNNQGYFKSFFVGTLSSINNMRTVINAVEDDKSTSTSKKISSLYILAENCECINELYGLLEKAAISLASKINTFNNKRMKSILTQALDYLNSNYMEPVTLGKVAESIHVSSYYLSRMFKKYQGKNFIDFLTEIRMEKAKELLKDTNLKTYEIAEKVGITDPQYFSKSFKKYASLTPTEYRDSLKE